MMGYFSEIYLNYADVFDIQYIFSNERSNVAPMPEICCIATATMRLIVVVVWVVPFT